jgi:formylglycine-generating enzyme required for sulfatase activity
VIGAVQPLELRDNAGPTAVAIPAPTDPDQDPLTVRITGLPRSGEVRVDGRAVTPGAVFAADRFTGATFKPDGSMLGPVGTLDILVEDGRGGSVLASLPINVLPSNRPPVVEAPRRLRIYTGALSVVLPEDPDGDQLAVTMRSLPRGLVRNGANTLRPGDRLRPEELAALVYLPEPGFTGPAGILQYQVEDGRGGRAETGLEIEVMDPVEAAAEMAETALWERLRTSGRAEDIEAFLQLYPNSRHAGAARRQLADIRGAASPASAAPQAAPVRPQQTASAPPAAPAPTTGPSAPPQPAASAPSGAERPSSPPPNPPTAQRPPREPPRPAEPPTPEPQRMAALPQPRAPAPAPPAAPADERYFQDCPTCPWMVRVPGGSFVMGQGARDSSAVPQHRVTVRPFALGQYPVTVAEWRACAAQGGCGPLPRMAAPQDSTPVHNVSWEDATRYIEWLSRTTGRPYRLPSEAEWEYAARGGTSTRYWWGEQPGIAQANCSDCGGAQNPRTPMPVDSFPPNPFGLYGMLGGVAQWTADCWFPNYQGAPTDGSARDARGCMRRVLRGGSFRSGRDDILPVARNFYDAPVRYLANGFRVARNLD